MAGKWCNNIDRKIFFLLWSLKLSLANISSLYFLISRNLFNFLRTDTRHKRHFFWLSALSNFFWMKLVLVTTGIIPFLNLISICVFLSTLNESRNESSTTLIVFWTVFFGLSLYFFISLLKRLRLQVWKNTNSEL